MKKAQTYNPLDKINLAKSIELELLGRSPILLSASNNIVGAGVYAIYYSGPFAPYAPIVPGSKIGRDSIPIYVGKAIPKGGRKGGLTDEVSATGRALAERLRNHANSISEASNLELSDFSFRYLVIEDIWIPLGENMLIETFKPLWNIALDGFGNKTPGRRRATQYKSPWDVVHPGRKFADQLANSPADVKFFTQRISDYFEGKALAKLPKVLAQQQAAQEIEAVESADNS